MNKKITTNGLSVIVEPNDEPGQYTHAVGIQHPDTNLPLMWFSLMQASHLKRMLEVVLEDL